MNNCITYEKFGKCFIVACPFVHRNVLKSKGGGSECLDYDGSKESCEKGKNCPRMHISKATKTKSQKNRTKRQSKKSSHQRKFESKTPKSQHSKKKTSKSTKRVKPNNELLGEDVVFGPVPTKKGEFELKHEQVVRDTISYHQFTLTTPHRLQKEVQLFIKMKELHQFHQIQVTFSERNNWLSIIGEERYWSKDSLNVLVNDIRDILLYFSEKVSPFAFLGSHGMKLLPKWNNHYSDVKITQDEQNEIDIVLIDSKNEKPTEKETMKLWLIRAKIKDDIAKLTKERLKNEKQLRKNAVVGVFVPGFAGAGKSTLCNKLFGDNRFRVSFGTTGTHKSELSDQKTEDLILQRSNQSIALCDSVGIEYELTKEESKKYKGIFEKHQELIRDRIKSIKERGIGIDCVWYCIDCVNGRPKRDVQLMNILKSVFKGFGIEMNKLIIVLNRCDLVNIRKLAKMKKRVYENFPGIKLFCCGENKVFGVSRWCPNCTDTVEDAEKCLKTVGENKYDFLKCKECQMEFSACINDCKKPHVVEERELTSSEPKWSCKNLNCVDKSTWKADVFKSEHEFLLKCVVEEFSKECEKLRKKRNQKALKAKKCWEKARESKSIVQKALMIDYEEIMTEIHELDKKITVADQKKMIIVKESKIPFLKAKIVSSLITISSFTVGAVIIGGMPIPFSDAILLAPLESALSLALVAIWGCKESLVKSVFSIMKKLGVGVAVATGAGVVGGVLGTFLKFIPGIGSIVGGILSGTVAGIVVATTGVILTLVLFEIEKGNKDVKSIVSKIKGKHIKVFVGIGKSLMSKNVDSATEQLIILSEEITTDSD